MPELFPIAAMDAFAREFLPQWHHAKSPERRWDARGS
jgi:hypothetical protein